MENSLRPIPLQWVINPLDISRKKDLVGEYCSVKQHNDRCEYSPGIEAAAASLEEAAENHHRLLVADKQGTRIPASREFQNRMIVGRDPRFCEEFRNVCPGQSMRIDMGRPERRDDPNSLQRRSYRRYHAEAFNRRGVQNKGVSRSNYVVAIAIGRKHLNVTERAGERAHQRRQLGSVGVLNHHPAWVQVLLYDFIEVLVEEAGRSRQ